MKSIIFSAVSALAIITIASPSSSVAQTRDDEARFDAAQQRFDREYDIYRSEVRRYQALRNSRHDDRYEGGYDPARYYREDPRYQERVLSPDERVYRGYDGRYYCKRSDGTTGLIIGGAAGGILGNVIDGGHSRAAGTLIGGALGALLGRSIEQQQDEIRCR